MYWVIVAIILSAINVELVLTQVVCVKPTYGYNDTIEDSCKKWSSIMDFPERYFTSNTNIKLLPGVYHTNSTYNLSITSVTNFSIAGIEANKTGVIIKCYCNEANNFINISNSSFVEIKDIKFVGCGAHMLPPKVKRRRIYPSTAAAAMVLQNVMSIRLIDICFENSYGTSIFGLNVMGTTLFKNITVFLTELKKTRVYSGGIILLYSNATDVDHGSTSIQNVLIDNFEIYNISSINQITWNVHSDTVYDTSVTSAVALGVMFNNHDFLVKVLVTHASMCNITSKTGPIIYALYNSSNVNNSLVIHNTSINNNSNEEEHPNIKIIIGTFPHEVSNRRGHAYLELYDCELSFNEAQSSNLVIEYSNDVINHGSMHLPFTLNLTSISVAYNKAVDSFLKTKFIEWLQNLSCFISIVQCTFIFNDGFTIEVDECSRSTLFKSNKFQNNSVSVKEQGVLVLDRSHPIFEGYNEFFGNIATIILTFSEYLYIKEGTIINISYNTAALGEINTRQTIVKALIHFETTDTLQLQPCAFQFLSNNIDQRILNYRIVFHHNQNYTSVIYGALLNSCHWLKNTAFKDLNSSFVYKRVLNFDSCAPATPITRQKSTIYFCDDTNQVEYFKENFKLIFPGQYIPVFLTLLPPFKFVVIYSNFTTDNLEYKMPHKPCEMQPYQFAWLQLVQLTCTSMSYKVYSNTFETCYVSFNTAYPDNSLYIYYVEFKKCPLGFSINNGSCECDKGLKATFFDLKCDIQTERITRAGRNWIGSSYSNGQWVILYTKHCKILFCNKHATDVQLHSPDVQCINNRAGIACAQCSSGLDAIFGSLKCKKCSNIWLLLLPAFMLAGILLVLGLFALDLTVVNGKINGFAMYTNSLAPYIYDISPPSFILIPISLFNLDLGIETCFYHGMTEYGKTWLQFAFPSYLLFIVAMLALASRYSGSVEKLTRRRVIPVIATIFLLSYNKLLLVTIKVLFSFTNIYGLPDNTKTVIWKWDSSIPLFGIGFSFLFVVCLIIFLFILIPPVLLLIFTKYFYHYNFVAKYLKPYLDAFQAPFKDNCRYYPGMELIIRGISFVVGNRIFDDHKTWALVNLVCVLLLVFLCSFRPFKSISNMVLYISFIMNIQCIIVLIIYSNGKLILPYMVILSIFMLIAFVEFGGIILYCIYTNYLYKIKFLQYLIMKVNHVTCKFKTKRTATQHDCPLQSFDNYEQYQEELLAIDPLH